MNAAVIIETRLNTPYTINYANHWMHGTKGGIGQIIAGHMKWLSDEWKLFIFHGDKNKHLFDNIKSEKINIGKLDTAADYNTLLTSLTFWEFIPYEKILIFQHDSMILRKGIEKFLQWDYIGAPIPSAAGNGKIDQNGGFSIRTKQIMIDIIKKYKYNEPYEDTYFSKYVTNVGKMAPDQEGHNFSCERKFRLGTLGYHQIDKHLTFEEACLVKNQYNPALYQGLR